MNCSFCEWAVPATANTAAPSNALSLKFRSIGTLLWMVISLFLQVIGMNSRAYYSRNCGGWENPPSVGERPEPQLFLGDLPQARKPQRLDDEEKDDERAEQDQSQVRHQPRGKGKTERALDRGGRKVHEDRQQHDEGSAQERTQDAADAADDDHEEDPEGKLELESRRFDRAQIRERVERAGHSTVK